MGRPQPFCLNYDIMAHETGHSILFSQIGVPEPDQISVPFLAFHESFADLVALIGVLHFGSVQTRLLEQTGGNLYALNLVNRIGEISDTEQIRLADNLATMDDVTGITLAADGTWIDPTGQERNQHAVAEPLTGAVFDMLVELYQDGLVRRGLIPPHSDPRGWTRTEVAASMQRVQEEHAAAYARFTQGFYAALARCASCRGTLHGACHADGPARDADIRSGRRALPGGGRRARAGIDHVRICWTISSGARSIRARF